MAIVLTADFFAPVVDDGYTFGRIAATNAVSDIYAMGGEPLVAVNLLGWPRDKLPAELAAEVLRGGLDVGRAAHCHIAGGHSIDDPEPKYGMAVTGTADPAALLLIDAGRPGLPLSLTKPIGTGVLNAWHKATGRSARPRSGWDQSVILSLATVTRRRPAPRACGPRVARPAARPVRGGPAGHWRQILTPRSDRGMAASSGRCCRAREGTDGPGSPSSFRAPPRRCGRHRTARPGLASMARVEANRPRVARPNTPPPATVPGQRIQSQGGTGQTGLPW